MAAAILRWFLGEKPHEEEDAGATGRGDVQDPASQSRRRRGRLIKCGTRIAQIGPHVFSMRSHRVSFGQVRPAYVDAFFACAWTPRLMHAGVLVRAHGPQIVADWSPKNKAWHQLLVHLVVVRNTVCLKFDLSDDAGTACEDICAVEDVGSQGKTRLVHVGRVDASRLAQAAATASKELEKPLFPLSRAEEDTSCLHFAMRLLYAMGVMPKWEWLTAQLPDDAPVRRLAAGSWKL